MRAFLIFLLLASTAAAQGRHPGAHSGPDHWYDARCCALNDCEPVAYGAVTFEPEGVRVRIEPGQHKMYSPYEMDALDALIPYDDERILNSQDGEHHVCLRGAGDWVSPTPDDDRILCVYISLSS